MREKWLACLNGHYEISNLGRLRRLKPAKGTTIGRLITIRFSRYETAGVQVDGIKRTVYIHTLVAEAFIGKRPSGKEVNHKNLDRTDNSVTNLEYITHAQNMKHATANGAFRNYPKGVAHHNAKFNREQVIEIRNQHLSGKYSYSSLAKLYGVDKQTAINVVKGISYAQLS